MFDMLSIHPNGTKMLRQVSVQTRVDPDQTVHKEQSDQGLHSFAIPSKVLGHVTD